MKGCKGPCDQGRKPCPCPSACGLEEPPEHDLVRVVLGDLIIAVALVGAVLLVLWGVMK